MDDTSDIRITTVSLTNDLHATLRAIAEKECRSISSQVRIFLADAVTRYRSKELDSDTAAPIKPIAEQ